MDHSLAAEPVAEALRNVLLALGVATVTMTGDRVLSPLEYAAIRLRLERALARLEHQPMPAHTS